MVHVPIDSAMCLVRGTGQRLLDRTWVDEDWPHDAYGFVGHCGNSDMDNHFYPCKPPPAENEYAGLVSTRP